MQVIPPAVGCEVFDYLVAPLSGGTVKKSDREIMEILEAFDVTGSAHSAARLAGVDPKTVRAYVAARDAGRPVTGPGRRERLIDPFLPKVEEWIERSDASIRADVVHERLVALGFTGDERTTRRAVHEVKARWRAGHRRTYRPWITEPGLWLQFDWGWGPKVPDPTSPGTMRATLLFCAWLAWSRFRVVIPTWDRTLPTLIACLDTTLRRIGGAPTYLLTDNEKTVTVDRVAGIPVRHPDVVAAGRHYGTSVHTCVPFDPESKGGAEATVRIAKADLVPTSANLRPGYASFGQLAAATAGFCDEVNGRVHRETGQAPATRLDVERTRLHPLPQRPHTLALGTTRLVNTDQTIRFGSVRYSTPPGLVGAEVWARADGDELVVVADLNALPVVPAWALEHGAVGLVEVARHRLSTPGRPRIDLSHYPDHPQRPDGHPRAPRAKASTPAEKAFLALGPGAHAWLVEAAASGAQRVRAKMADAVELAHLVGPQTVDAALGVAAAAGRFAETDLLSIVEHRAAGASSADLVHADETHSVQPGTVTWAGFTTTTPAPSTRLEAGRAKDQEVAR
jgi:transposase